jgi:hypothetical protein
VRQSLQDVAKLCKHPGAVSAVADSIAAAVAKAGQQQGVSGITLLPQPFCQQLKLVMPRTDPNRPGHLLRRAVQWRYQAVLDSMYQAAREEEDLLSTLLDSSSEVEGEDDPAGSG